MEGGPAAERGELLTVLSLDGDWDHEAILGPIFLWPGCRIQLGILLASMYLAEEKRGKCFHAVSLKESSRWEQRLFVVPLDFPGRRGLHLFIHNTDFSLCAHGVLIGASFAFCRVKTSSAPLADVH